jgi:hypothetical protein
MRTDGKKSFLETIPSAALAFITFFVATFLALFIGEGEKGHIGFGYIMYDLVIAVCSYFIVKKNHGSIWYVPIICNASGIISSIAEPTFWTTSLGIYMGAGLVLSIILSIMGALIGKKKNDSTNPVTN